jgi:hypothetical protein
MDMEMKREGEEGRVEVERKTKVVMNFVGDSSVEGVGISL